MKFAFLSIHLFKTFYLFPAELCFDVVTNTDGFGSDVSWEIDCAEGDCGSCQKGDFPSGSAGKQ